MPDKVTVAAIDLAKTYMVNGEGRPGFSLRKKRTEVKALKGVSFVAHSGESIGVLGKNGSGKSTLLRLIAGSETPTAGSSLVSAQPTLLGVSAALQSHLTGRANIRLGLLAMGLSPDHVDELVDEVAAFADIGDAVDRPMKTYSSGMSARLKFGISTAVKPEILLIDEALSTGDAAFSSRAKERMDGFLSGAGTVFLVSHGATTIQEHCSRAIWLHDGEIIADGEAESVTKSYRVWGNRVATGKQEEADKIIERFRDSYRSPQILLDSQAAQFLDNTESGQTR